jgi:hypothetical protein
MSRCISFGAFRTTGLAKLSPACLQKLRFQRFVSLPKFSPLSSPDLLTPDTGHETDDRSSLRKMPATFEHLIKKLGVFQAVKIMARLLFQEA